ncbi:hypothetical protein ACFYOR_05420 [Streptomyces griseofuscus]|uniref:hypothetical protein n=1 Tax=Streptomyces griseofuscus TaxID=146922 RepID=UPI00369EDF4A
MRGRIARILATGLTAGMLASGAAAVGTASAAPQAASASAVMAHHCHKVKGHHASHNGKKVWVKTHKVCTKK